MSRLDELAERLQSVDARLAHIATIVPMMRTDLLTVREEVDRAREWEKHKSAEKGKPQ